MSVDTNVFIAESVDPTDFYVRRLDGFAANEILKLRDQRTEYRVVMTRRLLKRAIQEAATGDFNIFHFSSHGNDDGVSLTDKTWLSWLEFAEIVKPFANENRHLVISSCQGGHSGMTKAFEKAGVIFSTVFGSTAEEINFTEACLAWSILYNRLNDHGFTRSNLTDTLDIINKAVEGKFVYRRWGGKSYLRYPLQSRA